MAVTISVEDRLGAVREAMAEAGVDTLFVCPSSDLAYLADMRGHASERPVVLAVPRVGEAVLLMPAFEAPGASDVGVRLVLYEETDEPYAFLVNAVAAGARCGISDQAWASVLLGLQAAFPDARFLAAGPVLARLRAVKSAAEIRTLEEAAQRADAAFRRIAERPLAGRTERQVAQELKEILRDEGLEDAGWGPIVASGPNSASPHHDAGDREISKGDAVLLDFGGLLEGYHADITRTVHVGPPSDEFRRVYSTVRQAQDAAVHAVRPGAAAGSIDSVARGIIDAAGYGDFFTHRTGHGIGLDDHEEPYIVQGSAAALVPGMTFSIEPGIYLPGRLGVRIEDIVAVTDDGVQRLNAASRELIVCT